MQECPICGTELHGQVCPSCGESPSPSPREIKKSLSKYSFLPFLGIFSAFAVNYFYPPLDRNTLLGIALCLFFFPVILHLISRWGDSLALDVSRLKKAYLSCGAAIVMLALSVGLNGALDMFPPKVVRASILRKTVWHGRYASSNHLIVASWRPGRANEDLTVGMAVYVRASVGRNVSIEVHQGLFGLPWLGKIIPE